jgi:predicted RNA-binding Zn-ribbon protein involved in translation (DUF1610 family)
MNTSLRRSEKWFRRGLWLVAVVFAWFLIGLGSAIVGDLPQVERTQTLEDFIDRPAAAKLRAALKQSQTEATAAEEALAQAQLKAQAARNDTRAAMDSFNNWVATRSATQRSDQDPDVIERTRAIDTLRVAERAAAAAVERQSQTLLDAQQLNARSQRELNTLQDKAREAWAHAQRMTELRVFAYRLALTLPLLALAAWLFVKKRHGTYWPFVWGFIFFAGFVFFVELVPYLPSYGGYVHYAVGIVMTVLIGRHAIRALNAYLERQRQAEALPDAQRREELSLDMALARLAKGVCPGCERPVDLKDPSIDYCPHCGIGLHHRCHACNTRKSAFARYCHSCGAGAQKPEPAHG